VIFMNVGVLRHNSRPYQPSRDGVTEDNHSDGESLHLAMNTQTQWPFRAHRDKSSHFWLDLEGRPSFTYGNDPVAQSESSCDRTYVGSSDKRGLGETIGPAFGISRPTPRRTPRPRPQFCRKRAFQDARRRQTARPFETAASVLGQDRADRAFRPHARRTSSIQL
jgi:hypothetical protein